MNARRVLLLSITALLAGLAGYGLLGLRAPKAGATAAAQTAGLSAPGQGTIIAVGPDGTLYTVNVPTPGYGDNGYGATAPQTYARRDGREREEYDDGPAYRSRYE